MRAPRALGRALVVLLAVAASAHGAAPGGSAAGGDAELPLEAWDRLFAELREGVWMNYAATAALGRDGRGRTVADDLDEWVMAPAARAALAAARDLAAARYAAGDPAAAEAALESAATARREQVNRLELVSYYWRARFALARQRDRWQRLAARAPPVAQAESRGRLDPLETALLRHVTPAATWQQLAAEVEALERAYNRERARLVAELPAGMPGPDAARERARPCPVTPPPAVARSGARPVRLGDGDAAADLFYPAAARDDGVEGEVLLRVAVDARGCAQRAAVLRSSGAPELDDAAMEWTEYARFEPAVVAGRPVAADAGVRVAFAVGDDRPASGAPAQLVELAGIRLGSSRATLAAGKGPPLARQASGWVYNSRDARHDGIVTAYFDASADRIVQIEYLGDRDSTPPELPALIGATRAELRQLYGEPIGSLPVRDGGERLYFPNGVYAIVAAAGRVTSYGIADLAHARPPALPRVAAEVVALP